MSDTPVIMKYCTNLLVVLTSEGHILILLGMLLLLNFFTTINKILQIYIDKKKKHHLCGISHMCF